MYYFVVPESDTVLNEDGTERPYGWVELHAEVVITHEKWREDSADVLAAYDEVADKCFDAKAGSTIALSDKTYEIYCPVVTLRGMKVNPTLARQFNRLVRPVLSASRKPPKGYVERVGGEDGGDGAHQALAGAGGTKALPAAET